MSKAASTDRHIWIDMGWFRAKRLRQLEKQCKVWSMPPLWELPAKKKNCLMVSSHSKRYAQHLGSSKVIQRHPKAMVESMLRLKPSTGWKKTCHRLELLATFNSLSMWCFCPLHRGMKLGSCAAAQCSEWCVGACVFIHLIPQKQKKNVLPHTQRY